MVTLNMESQTPKGRVYAENRSKMQKLLRGKGLRNAVLFSINFNLETIAKIKQGKGFNSHS